MQKDILCGGKTSVLGTVQSIHIACSIYQYITGNNDHSYQGTN